MKRRPGRLFFAPDAFDRAQDHARRCGVVLTRVFDDKGAHYCVSRTGGWFTEFWTRDLEAASRIASIAGKRLA